MNRDDPNFYAYNLGKAVAIIFEMAKILNGYKSIESNKYQKEHVTLVLSAALEFAKEIEESREIRD